MLSDYPAPLAASAAARWPVEPRVKQGDDQLNELWVHTGKHNLRVIDRCGRGGSIIQRRVPFVHRDARRAPRRWQTSRTPPQKNDHDAGDEARVSVGGLLALSYDIDKAWDP